MKIRAMYEAALKHPSMCPENLSFERFRELAILAWKDSRRAYDQPERSAKTWDVQIEARYQLLKSLHREFYPMLRDDYLYLGDLQSAS
jgi:hypothetical protein